MDVERQPTPDAPGKLDTRLEPAEALSQRSSGDLSMDECASNPPCHSNSYRELDLIVVSQNIRGVQGFFEPDGRSRDLGKLEILTRVLLEQHIDVYLIQETWLTGDWIRIINGVTVIHHGPDTPTSRRGSGGVAILLSQSATKAWTFAGRPDPLRPGPIGDAHVRFMGIHLLFHPRCNQTQRLFIGNVYAPHSGLAADDPQLLERFYTSIKMHLSRLLPPSTDIVLGGDWNAALGTRSDPTDQSFLGPFGLDHSNAAAEPVFDLCCQYQLRVSTSYFKSCSYATFYDQLHDRRPLQLDHFLSSQGLGNRVTRAGT